MDKNHNHLAADLAIVLLSIFVAILLARTGILEDLVTSTREIRFLGSFIAGIMFSSVFTAALGTVTLGEIAQANSVFMVAIMGGLGALIGDLIIFRFVKDKLSEDLLGLFKSSRSERLAKIWRKRGLRWLTPVIGAIIIASPLPDEVGVAMLGLSKMKNSLFIPLSFILNSAGILIIGIIAKNL